MENSHIKEWVAVSKPLTYSACRVVHFCTKFNCNTAQKCNETASFKILKPRYTKTQAATDEGIRDRH